jgi:hypothetical protein
MYRDKTRRKRGPGRGQTEPPRPLDTAGLTETDLQRAAVGIL